MTPAVKILLVSTGTVFLLQALSQYVLGIYLERLLGLVPELLFQRYFLWQPVTYIFLHGGLFHLLWNLLILWMFGCELERVWGRRFFLKYFFVCGVGAGLCIALLSPYSRIPTIGASGALYGILLAYGLLFPDRQILLWFLVPIRARYFVLIIGLIAFYSTLTLPGSGVSHVAHLSGLLVGYVYLRGWRHIRDIRQTYLKWKLKRLKKKYRVIDGKGDDGPPYIH